MIGVESKNEKRTASSCERPVKSPPAIVEPVRENPGNEREYLHSTNFDPLRERKFCDARIALRNIRRLSFLPATQQFRAGKSRPFNIKNIAADELK